MLDKIDELRDRVAPHRRARVAAVARIAADVVERCDVLGVRRPEQAPQRAADLLRLHGAAVLPARAVLVHGFADLTGVAADLLQAVLAVHDGVVLVDRPLDPASPDREDAGVAFLDRLDVQLGGLARTVSRYEPPVVTPVAFFAPTVEAEARQVAHRVRLLLDDGVEPEQIGIVCRELGLVASVLRRQLDRLAIPYSGAETTVPGGATWRQGRLLAAVLRAGSTMPAELWLEACAPPGSRTELLLALRTLGISRLDEVATLDGVADGVSLPMPVIDPAGELVQTRRVEGAQIQVMTRHARAFAAELESWPARGPSQSHGSATRATIAALGWQRDEPSTRAVTDEVERLQAEISSDLKVTRDEWLETLCRRLEGLGEEPVGGAGGGVQLLSAMEARARTFRHLFLICLNRGVFPRVVQEDALLPDEVRGHLAAEVLPEFPVKARGLDEERYLFAQLVSSADRITLSWHLSVEGSAVAPSPFVERLRREGRLEVSDREAPAPLGLPADGSPDPLVPRPAFEHAILAAEHGRRDRLAPILATAWAEGRKRSGLAGGGPRQMGAGAGRCHREDRPRPSGTGTGPVGRPGGWVRETGHPACRPSPVSRASPGARCSRCCSDGSAWRRCPIRGSACLTPAAPWSGAWSTRCSSGWSRRSSDVAGSGSPTPPGSSPSACGGRRSTGWRRSWPRSRRP